MTTLFCTTASDVTTLIPQQYGHAVIDGRQQFFPTPIAILISNACSRPRSAFRTRTYEAAFGKKMADPMWVAEIAAGWRAEMLSPNAIHDEVEMAIDHWAPILEQLVRSDTKDNHSGREPITLATINQPAARGISPRARTFR